MREPKKTRYSLYLEELTELAKQQVEDKLKTKMRARIYEKDGPSLLRDEYDETDVLFLVYAERRQAQDEKSLQHLRKAAVELFMEALCETEPNLTIINHLGHLAALYEFRKDKPLTDHLSNELFGFLSGRLRHPLEHLANLDGIQLALAVNALDMWVATHTFSAELRLPGHTLERIRNLFLHTVEIIGDRPDVNSTQRRLLFVAFQAAILFQPEWTGKHGLVKMISAIHNLSTHSPDIKKRWFGLCRKYAVLFRQIPEWGEGFREGLSELELTEQPVETEDIFSLLRDSLERCGVFVKYLASIDPEGLPLANPVFENEPVAEEHLSAKPALGNEPVAEEHLSAKPVLGGTSL
jgi:hypothetical protein